MHPWLTALPTEAGYTDRPGPERAPRVECAQSLVDVVAARRSRRRRRADRHRSGENATAGSEERQAPRGQIHLDAGPDRVEDNRVRVDETGHAVRTRRELHAEPDGFAVGAVHDSEDREDVGGAVPVRARESLYRVSVGPRERAQRVLRVDGPSHRSRAHAVHPAVAAVTDSELGVRGRRRQRDDDEEGRRETPAHGARW
jgi:hypothetical protein